MGAGIPDDRPDSIGLLHSIALGVDLVQYDLQRRLSRFSIADAELTDSVEAAESIDSDRQSAKLSYS